MCVGDWRLGRLMSIQVTPWSTAGGSGLTYPANMQRVGIMIACIEFDPTTPNGVKIQVDGNNFTAIGPGQNLFSCNLANNGLLSTHAFKIATIGVGSSGSTIEWFLPESYLAACLKSFESEYAKYLQP